MTAKTIIKMLEAHSVPYKVVDEHILADSMLSGTEIFEKTLDVTRFTKAELLSWLGY